MADTFIAENGDTFVSETVAGTADASSLNDTTSVRIYSDSFTVNPLSNGWTLGTGWAWDSVNMRLAKV